MIVFEHPCSGGPLHVAQMFDIEHNETSDIDAAIMVICPLPNDHWLVACTCRNCGGRLKDVPMRVQ